ncbi:MAG: Type 1 glutamine amidotransferase-like domain-containing protein [Planctomycetota bacterium]|nr:Type 1 glutamine amidotransferase-like domain-containing protein [Planctomycetota bacterium]
MSIRVVLLGPQRLAPTLVDAVDSLGIDGPIASITAGWEEREGEDRELEEHLRGRVVNLRVYGRAEEIYEADPELRRALLQRHETIRKLRDLYRLRLAHALDAARQLLRRDCPEGEESILEPERAAAIEAVRDLDAHHRERVREVHAAFEAGWRPEERDDVARHREEIAQALKDTAALGVAGGHVNILLNRMRLLGLPGLAAKRPIVAWSAGAMVLGEQVVLFHDSPPQGAGNAEVLEPGLGLFRGVIPLPHARRRLRLDDAMRVELFARRFSPDLCVPMDEGARLDWNGKKWTAHDGTRLLTEDGAVAEEWAA